MTVVTAQLTYFKDARSFVALNVTILSVRDTSYFLLSYVAFSQLVPRAEAAASVVTGN